MNGGRLIVVSNRLPVTIERAGREVHAWPSTGGLVSALLPAFRENGGCWVGWPGTDADPEVVQVLRTECAPEYSFEPVFLSDSEQRCFYHGWSNEIIWPLFHDLQSNCNFDPDYWLVYRDANEKFADVVERVSSRKDFIWVHDYHLMMVADALRSRGVSAKMAYFHHIPFPAPDIFEKLPWRNEILRGLLQFTSLGFQSERDSNNFIACLRRCFEDVVVEKLGDRSLVRAGGATASVGVFPISIDYQAFAGEAADEATASRAALLRREFQDRKLVLGLDRLDYTKGVLERLAGFRALLTKQPGLRGAVTLLQVVVPSRETIPQYAELRSSIERVVSQINGEFGTPGWNPISYWHRRLSRPELVALYRAADVALITPLKDGMNLVAKEFCACRVHDDGVLVLSEFAGAAAELRAGALLVNPYDTEALAATLLKSLRMSTTEQRERMRGMRRTIKSADVYQWCQSVWREVGFRAPRQDGRITAVLQPYVAARAI